MSSDGGSPTASLDDPRLTKTGKFLRKYKLDEIPTLWNLIKGDIALCGPRADVPSEIASLGPEMADAILRVKPGIISPATLWDFHEDEILKGSKDPHKDYCEKIKPKKYELNLKYIKEKNLWLDTKLVAKTILKTLRII